MEREKGPVEILCKEIGFRFGRQLETQSVFISFVTVLVSQVGDIRRMQERLAGIPGVFASPPSIDSAAVLQRVLNLLSLADVARDKQTLIDGAAEVHGFIHEVAPDEAYPCDHLIDMLSSCVSAIRFGLETPCHSRHAAEAASHIWKHRYGVTLFDDFTPEWEKDWARAQLQEAITRLALASKQPVAA